MKKPLKISELVKEMTSKVDGDHYFVDKENGKVISVFTEFLIGVEDDDIDVEILDDWDKESYYLAVDIFNREENYIPLLYLQYMSLTTI